MKLGEKDMPKIDEIIKFDVENDFGYFPMYDTLTGTVSSDKGMLPALANSCYVSLEEVFSPSRDS